jgi:transposase
MDPPPYLFFFDECPGIQVLKRLFPYLQTEEMKIRLEEFEYIRNGTIDVFAFLNHANGKIYLECHGDHKTEVFISVFRNHVSKYPTNEKLHYVMDNLSSHLSYEFCQTVANLSGVNCPPKKELKTQEERVAWLRDDTKKIVLHFIPCHGSWLNLVEIWFGILGRNVLNESFGTPDSLISAIYSFVVEWNLLLAHPFKWSYKGENLHELAVKRFTKILETSAEQMEVRTLTKSLMLMTNLLNDYYSKVFEKRWEGFSDTLSRHLEDIVTVIKKEEGPKRKIKAENALAELITILKKQFVFHEKIAA